MSLFAVTKCPNCGKIDKKYIEGGVFSMKNAATTCSCRYVFGTKSYAFKYITVEK